MISRIVVPRAVGNKREGRSAYVTVAAATALSLFSAGCTAPQATVKETRTKEYFAESEYGVKASPRVVSTAKSGLRRGGGQYKLGKAYQVKGRWYRPAENPAYAATGGASWYGDAFHGRLTANGEVYDMSHLTAAHPTMPLPSYARVTNLSNGSSVVVRVNDRGPFAKGRIIDVSKRAAEMLDYKQAGVAKVRVEYVGPAPLHGQDDQFLMASYRPGDTAPGFDGLPEGVMVALNDEKSAAPAATAVTAFAAATRANGSPLPLPATGPIVPDRPQPLPAEVGLTELALLSYADQRVRAAFGVFDAVLGSAAGEEKSASVDVRDGEGAFINLGTLSSPKQVRYLEDALAGMGRVSTEKVAGVDLYVASFQPESDAYLDRALRAAWDAGAVDAFIVRD